ncbi:radical SAM protein [Ktedonosporobacter rubrisoli]|uniref:Radical SAM protein n=1 Tax=Ktedonosporobacter rubrisoli TaxID=2509675 RepID=A0A4V0YZV2_KTERU|nr:radical SAM protein [Ktedonosporobacter rubrisoli]QBD81011.1 radical SAM protein [Ktedonosporobacter rubrisoli]
MKNTKLIQFKVDKERVLVPVGQPCPFGCRYCYTRTGEVGPARVKPAEILELFQEFAKTHAFEFIQFGYDGEPFVQPERGVAMLRELAVFAKDISFSTKAYIKGQTLEALATLQQTMLAAQTTLVGIVSLSCWDSALSVEPHTPTPDERIATLANLKRIEIPTFIAVRPILPHLSLQEFEQLTIQGLQANCDGFILGPLYSDDKGRFARCVPGEVLKKTPHQTIVVSWSAHSPLWRRYEDEKQVQAIADMIEAKGGRIFMSSADVLKFASRKGAMA